MPGTRPHASAGCIKTFGTNGISASPSPALRPPGARRNVSGARYRGRVLEAFHPAVRTWFERRFPDGPTEPQAAGWREIAAGGHTLIAAPTGSGKPLAAFLVCIDRLYRAWEAAPEEAVPGPSVVYVSPLKALAVDIQQNLEAPLRE